jgi:imidazole glycerol phosphate synthase glutamine amidotransferase subunit
VIALLDYGSGNLRSVHKALLKVGADVRIVQMPDKIGDARAMVLPGVGAFDDCITALRKQGLLEAAREFIKGGRPFLGICVGYQALFEKSEEFNSCAAGLGIFKGSVIRFSEKHGLKIPQIGWNQLEIVKPDCPLFEVWPMAATSISSTAFIRNRWIRALSQHARITAIPLHRPSGATMFSPRNFTRKKARRLVCNC